MHALRRILVAVRDPKSRFLPAVVKAAQLARGSGAEIELFHAITAPIQTDALGYSQSKLAEIKRVVRERSAAELERIAQPLRRKGITVTTSTGWDFPAYEAVVRRANHSHPDLIVAERHHDRRLRAWSLHRNDRELLQLSPVPVLLVKDDRRYRRPNLLAALDPSHSFSKPEKLDLQILQVAGLVAHALRGKLHAVHAYVPSPLLPVDGEIVSAKLSSELDAAALARARGALERALRPVRIPAAQRHLICSSPVDGIQDIARKTGAAIVVMGAVSRRGIKGLFIGNTAQRVLDKLSCDVLVVKPSRFISRVASTRRGTRVVATVLSPH